MSRSRTSRIAAALLFLAVSAPCAALENSSLLYRKAADMAFSGDVQGAIPLFRKVTELSPSFVLGHYGLGKAYLYVDGHLDDAVSELKKAVECDRSFSKAHFYLGMAYMFRKDYAWAIDSFHQAYIVDRTCIEALYNMGAIFDFMGHPFKSRKYFGDYRAAKQGDSEPF